MSMSQWSHGSRLPPDVLVDADLDGDGEVAVGDPVPGLPHHVIYQLRLVDETGADPLLLGPALGAAAVEVNALTPPGDSVGAA